MKFAMLLPVGDITPGEFQSATAVAEMAAALEAANVDACFVTDHPAPSTHWLHANGHDALDPFTALAFVAAASRRLHMFTNILVLPYRNPFLTAKSAATLQVLSGGRFTLGVGCGYQQAEFDALGVDFNRRGALMDEAIEVIREIWSGAVVKRRGRDFSFDASGNEARPVPDPVPPIWIGGSSDRAVQRAARLGDGWCPYFSRPGLSAINQNTALFTTEQLATKIDQLHAQRAALDRSGPFDIAIGPSQRPSPDAPDTVHEYLSALADFAAAGVTMITVVPPSPSRHAWLDYVAWFGDAVISRFNPAAR